MKKIQTVGLIVENGKILLGMKKRGFGKGKWNGFGGNLEQGETPEQAMRREFFEEASVKVSKLREVGLINFSFTDDPVEPEVHFFEILKYHGDPTESEEMLPKWFDIADIPYDSMWPDDKYWVPLFLAGKSFRGNFLFGEKGEIIKYNIHEV